MISSKFGDNLSVFQYQFLAISFNSIIIEIYDDIFRISQTQNPTSLIEMGFLLRHIASVMVKLPTGIRSPESHVQLFRYPRRQELFFGLFFVFFEKILDGFFKKLILTFALVDGQNFKLFDQLLFHSRVI